MSDDQNSKKVIALRTFADDVKRARVKQGDEEIPETHDGEPKKDTASEEIPNEKSITTPDVPPPTNETVSETPSPTGLKTDGRELSDDDISLDDIEEVQQDDVKETLREEESEPKETPDAPSEEGPMEIPPFHFIRSSSPDDSTYHDEHDIPDKNSLKKETVRKTAPPKHESVPTRSLSVDTDVVPEYKTSIHSNKDGIFDTEEASLELGEGTIVTDRKRKRFRLFHAIGVALGKWFGGKKDAIQKAREPKHTVVKSDRRKDVIKAAARQTKRAPADDYSRVSDRLKNVERITTTEELNIKDAADVPAPSWQHTDGGEERDGALSSLEEAVHNEDPSEVGIHIPNEKEPDTQAPQPENLVRDKETTEENEPPPTSVETTLRSAQNKNDVGYTEYREKYGEDFSPREDTFEESLPVAPENVSIEETEKPRFNRTPVPDYRLDREGRPVKQSRGTPILTLIAVVVAAIILGVGTSVWWFTRDTNEEEVVAESPAPEFTKGQSSSGVPLSTDRTVFFKTLMSAVNQGGQGTTYLYATIDETLASAETVFNTLNLSAPGSFTRAVATITFGSYNSSEPFIVLAVTSFDTAFSGMLEWERNMSGDLAPLFGPQQLLTPVDSRINNRDVRALIAPDNTDKIVYGFINKNTILITTNRQAYSAIAPLVK